MAIVLVKMDFMIIIRNVWLVIINVLLVVMEVLVILALTLKEIWQRDAHAKTDYLKTVVKFAKIVHILAYIV